jgi:hypothetical protein
MAKGKSALSVSDEMLAIAKERESRKDHYFDPYIEHSKTLRTWFVAYGIGAPVLFASQKELLEKLVDYSCIKSVVILLLLGVLLQIVLTFLSKTTNYQYYQSSIHFFHRSKRMYKYSTVLTKQYYWAIPLVDFTTIILFIWATILVLQAWS